MRSRLTLVLLLLLATPALAVDGVLEINQTCAVQTGCFAGDTAGFPVTIDGGAGRSYRLTSDLAVPDENTDGLLISGIDIGIDLNNFAIIGPVICELNTSPPNCTPGSGQGSGIKVSDSFNQGIAVKNGSIIGMGLHGIKLGNFAEVTGVRARWNNGLGIFTVYGSTVSGNTVSRNGANGIDTDSSTVSGNTIMFNSGVGIAAGNSTISGNTVLSNQGAGISAGNGATVSGNTVRSNQGGGITASGGGDHPNILDNNVVENIGFGIRVGDAAAVRRNNIYVNTNGGFGLELGSNASYGGNTIATREGVEGISGTVTGGVNAGGNVCNGSLTCP